MFQIFVRTITNRTIIICQQNITPKTSIKKLRESIAKKENQDPKTVKLIFAGKQLSDTLSNNQVSIIQDYGIMNQSTLFMVLRLTGGSSSGYFSETKILIEHSNTSYVLKVNHQWTVYQLKQKIYQKCHKSLGIHTMKLSFAGVKLSNQKLLSTYKFKPGNKIIQSKCDLNQVIGLIVAYEQDQITLETITARMPCGHVIGRDCMTGFLRSLITHNSYKIMCPSYKPNGDLCECEWDYPLCRKIGVLTKQENEQFQKGLSENWIRTFCVQCPSCHNMLQQDQKSKQSNEKKIICPNKMCKNNKQYFCWGCLKKWNSINKLYCGNQDYLNQEITEYRKCPNCNIIIEHIQNCKHIACKCKKQFCFVCLNLRGEQGWLCGGAFDYCGQIADRQT